MTAEFFIMWFALATIGILIYYGCRPKQNFNSEELERMGFKKTKNGYQKQVTAQDVERIVKKVSEVIK